MAYCSLTDLLQQLDELSLVQLSNDADSATTVDQVNIGRAIDDAAAMIDSYCAGRYLVPFSPVPAVVRQQAVTLAISNLFFRRQGMPPGWEPRYNGALSWLKGVAKGDVSITDAAAPVSAASPGQHAIAIECSPKLFGRGNLRDY